MLWCAAVRGGVEAILPGEPEMGNQKEGKKEKPLNVVPVNVAVGNPNADEENSGKAGSFMKPNKRGLSMKNKVIAKKRLGNYEKKIDLFGETEPDVEGLESRGCERWHSGTSFRGEGLCNRQNSRTTYNGLEKTDNQAIP